MGCHLAFVNQSTNSFDAAIQVLSYLEQTKERALRIVFVHGHDLGCFGSLHPAAFASTTYIAM